MNKEAIEHLTKNVVFWDNEGGKIAQIPRDDYDQALALLTEPKCKTCGGSKRVPSLFGMTQIHSSKELMGHTKPCPACQAPEQPNCEGCEFFKHTHSNEHCYRYTEEPSLCKLRQEPVEQPPEGDFTKKARRRITTDRAMISTKIDDTQNDLPYLIIASEALDRLEEACIRLDRSEASREDLLMACESALEFIGRSNKTDWDNEITPILEAAIKSNKEISEKK